MVSMPVALQDTSQVHHRIKQEGVLFEELKFNKHCSTFVLFDKKFPILD
jgi:hypothetical protein